MSKEFLKYETETIEFVENDIDMVTETTYRVFTDGTKEQACSVTYTKLSDEPIEPKPTQLDNIEDTQTTLMLAMAEQYEKQLALEENQNTIMLALADMYESQLN